MTKFKRISELDAGAVMFSLVFVAMLFLSLWGVYHGTTTVYRAHYSPDWPAVAGVITSSRLVRVNKRGQAPEVTYYYVVDGRNYTGDTVSFSGYFLGGGGRSSADVVSQYQTGKEVRVFYQPGAPGVSCLEPGANGWYLYLTVPIAGLVGLFALFNLKSILRSA